MLSLFGQFASWLVYSQLGLEPDTRLGSALHFFVEDTTKIFFLLVLMIYIIALLRASLNVVAVRDYLAGKPRAVGYVMGSVLGAVTPFCSCSSIPVFLGFTSAGIPVGITMAFLLTSPLINEVAVILLLSLVGWQITLIYIALGLIVGIICGAILDALHAEKNMVGFAQKAYAKGATQPVGSQQRESVLTLRDRHEFAWQELTDIFSRVWKWVFIGVGLGAALHGFVPDHWIESYLSGGNWWSVPAAVLLGIPLYSNATGVIPVMESLIVKGLPLGTTIAFCMSTVAASFPEFILLKQVMHWKLLSLIFIMLLISFTVIGWLLNLSLIF